MTPSESERTGRPTDDPISRRLLELLRSARRDRGMSIYTLAARIGKTPSYVSLVENGKQVPDVETIERIAKVLRLDKRLLRAWVDVRRSPDATSSIAAAHELVALLGIAPDAAERPAVRSPGTAYRLGPADREAPAALALSAAGAPGGPSAEEVHAGQVRIPVVASGTEPGHPDEQRSHPRRPLWLDRRLLPPMDELREPFAFRVGRESGRRVRGLVSRGDYVVVARIGPRLKPTPKEIFAVRVDGGVVLSRVDHQAGKLVLLPGRDGEEVRVLEAGTTEELARLIAGRVVAVGRVFQGEGDRGTATKRRTGG